VQPSTVLPYSFPSRLIISPCMLGYRTNRAFR
jgi:hypothetical protein